MGLEVGGGRAHVLPVAVGHVPVQRITRVEDSREHLAREVHGPAIGDATEDLGLEDIDARVDGVAEDLAPARLLEEALDGPVLAVITMPNSSGFSTAHRRDVASALFFSWNEITDVRSMSVRTSPEITRKRSVSCSRALRTEPAVPSGDSSVAYTIDTPSSLPSPK